MPVDVFLPLLPKVYSEPQRISPSSLVYHCVACVLVSLQKEGAAYARKGARPEPIAARAWRIGLGPIARATAQQKPRENGAFVTMDGYLNAGLWGIYCGERRGMRTVRRICPLSWVYCLSASAPAWRSPDA